MSAVLQYYLKCQQVETGQILTYRFSNEQDLLNFSKLIGEKLLSIIDTHIVFYDIQPLFNPFNNDAFDHATKINSGDINTALDGRVQLHEWLQ